MRDLEYDPRQLRRDFSSDGFVSLPDFLDAGELKRVLEHKRLFLEARLPTLPAEHVYYEDRHDKTTLKQVQRLHEHDEFFGRLMAGSRFEALARALLGEEVSGRNLQYFNKLAGVGLPTPPHQDGQFFMLQPCNAVTLWLALEDVELGQGCVRYLRGSHAQGLRAHRESGVLGFSQCLQEFEPQGGDVDVRAFPCKAGQLIAHHAMTVHWSGPNTRAGTSREALGFIYYGVSAREDTRAQIDYQRQLAARLTQQGKL